MLHGFLDLFNMEWILILERIMDIAQKPSGWLRVSSIILSRNRVRTGWGLGALGAGASRLPLNFEGSMPDKI